MPNRTVSWLFRSFVIFGFAVALSACGYFGQDTSVSDSEAGTEAMEASESSGQTLEMHAEACPHGGGACCAQEEPHPCCEHSLSEEGGAESQATSQPSEESAG